jgi:hypothetical protein
VLDLPRLPLDSPRWLKLTTDGSPRAEVPRLLRQIQEEGTFGEAWERLVGGPILHQGTVYQSTYAALPHLVAIAAEQDPRTLARFWTDAGFIVASFVYTGLRPGPTPIPAALKEGVAAALRAAEPLAVRCFRAREWGLEKTETGVETASYLALACLALARHPVGALIRTFLHAPRPGQPFTKQQFVNAMCGECQAELEFFHAGDGIIEYQFHRDGKVRPDPEQPEPEAPEVPDLTKAKRADHPWGPIADALARPARQLRTLEHETRFPADWLKQFGAHVPVAAAVAAAGVPSAAADRAVLSLLGVLVALSGAFDWAGRLLRLAGFMRCPECGAVQPFAGGLVIPDGVAAP